MEGWQSAGVKANSPRASGKKKKKPFLLNIEVELLERIRERAAELDKDIGQYLSALARADIAKGGDFVVVPKASPPRKTSYLDPLPGSATSPLIERDDEQARAEEGKSPPGKRKAG